MRINKTEDLSTLPQQQREQSDFVIRKIFNLQVSLILQIKFTCKLNKLHFVYSNNRVTVLLLAGENENIETMNTKD